MKKYAEHGKEVALKKMIIIILILTTKSQTYLFKCPTGCRICSNSETSQEKRPCLECEIAYKLVNKTCLECEVNYCKVCAHDIESCTLCINGFFKKKISTPIKDSYICQKCPINCSECNSQKDCAKCNTLYKLSKDKTHCIIDKSSIMYITFGGFFIGSLFGLCAYSMIDSCKASSMSVSSETNRDQRILVPAGGKKPKTKKKGKGEKKEVDGDKAKKILEEKFGGRRKVRGLSKKGNILNLHRQSSEPPLSSQRLPFNDLGFGFSSSPRIDAMLRESQLYKIKPDGEVIMNNSKRSFSFGGNQSGALGKNKVKVKKRVALDGSEDEKEQEQSSQ